MITKENYYKYKDKKMLKTWSKGELINFIFQLINIIEEEKECESPCLEKINSNRIALGEIERLTYEDLEKIADRYIAKAPHLEGDGYADGQLVYDTWVCPECGEHYEIDYDHYEYCPKCGQHIDWSQIKDGE